MLDKEIEKLRYDSRAESILVSNSTTSQDPLIHIPAYLSSAYVHYHSLLKSLVTTDSDVLEIGAGMGEHSFSIINSGANALLTDISSSSLEVIKKRYSTFSNFTTKVAEVDDLSFESGSFDLISSAGVLSYGDNMVVMNRIYDLLKKGGYFVCVDSLNHNPIYQLNRYLHYKKGARTKSTLERMPKIDLLDQYSILFGKISSSYFGSISWLCPLVAKFSSPEKAKLVSDWFDQKFSIKKSAFKFVMCAQKN